MPATKTKKSSITARYSGPWDHAGHPKLDPLPAGIKASDDVRGLGDAYDEALNRLRAAELEHRTAISARAKAVTTDANAIADARKNGTPWPEPTATAFREREALAEKASAEAFGDVVHRALGLADAMAATRTDWKAASRDHRREAEARVGELLDDLDEALRVMHAEAEIERVLDAWKYDHTAPIEERWKRLRAGGTSVPQLRNIDKLLTVLHAERMKQVRFEAERRLFP